MVFARGSYMVVAISKVRQLQGPGGGGTRSNFGSLTMEAIVAETYPFYGSFLKMTPFEAQI